MLGESRARGEKLILRAYRSASYQRWRRRFSLPRNPLYFRLRAVYFHMPAGFLLPRAGSRHESQTRGPNANREPQKNFTKSTNRAKLSARLSRNESKAESGGQNALVNDKKRRGCEEWSAGWIEEARRAKWRKKLRKRFVSLGSRTREDRDVTSNRGRARTRERTSEGHISRWDCANLAAEVSFSASKYSRKIRDATYQSLALFYLTSRCAIDGGRDTTRNGITRITEIRRLHSE